MAAEPALTVAVFAATSAAVVLRPWRLAEAWWAVAGAVLVGALGLLTPRELLQAVHQGWDVYLFLAGMMLLSELARSEGLFDAAAAVAVAHARGSGWRLFTLVYAMGVLVTAFLSNDATAVVLTPAVYAVCQRAGARPLPYLLACALVANAASFVLPVSNPANLVVFGAQLPPLGTWLLRFGPAALAAVALTYAVLVWRFREAILHPVQDAGARTPLSGPARVALAALVVSTVVLMVCSWRGTRLGLPTLAVALASLVAVGGVRGRMPFGLLRKISWHVLPLVGGLFVLVAALTKAGVARSLADHLLALSERSPALGVWAAGLVPGFVSNLTNNLPAGLMAGSVARAADAASNAAQLHAAMAVGIDLGPNLSITGSLATLLWLDAIRREGGRVSGWEFLRVGAVAMPLALFAALALLGR
jgi:arsenical pump membrane protein